MAETKATDTKAEEQKKSEETNSGTHSPEVYETADTQVAAKAGLTEGDVKALRDDAGVNQSAGHESDIHAWSLSVAGKKHASEAKDREKAAKDEADAYAAQGKGGLSEADLAYLKAVNGK